MNDDDFLSGFFSGIGWTLLLAAAIAAMHLA
jgi:hypothetical protein